MHIITEGLFNLQFLSTFFSDFWLYALISAVAAYLLSSINTSIIVTRIVKHEDIRNLGSGNPGFTNVLRCVGKVPAAITFIGDFLKGVISLIIPFILTINVQHSDIDLYRGLMMHIAGLSVVFGHMFPVYYGFKGGKGVVASASVMLLVDWRILVLELVIFAIMFALTKTISKCSLVCAVFIPVLTVFLRIMDAAGVLSFIAPTPNPSIAFICCIGFITLINAVAVIVKHKDNIKRILNGTEKKITDKK